MRIISIVLFITLSFSIHAQQKLSLVKDIVPGYSDNKGIKFTSIFSDSLSMFFVSDKGEIFRSSGTQESTKRVNIDWSNSSRIKYNSMQIFRGELYFMDGSEYDGNNLWKTNGDKAKRITNYPGFQTHISNLNKTNESLLFVKHEGTAGKDSLYALIEGKKLACLKSSDAISIIKKVNNLILFFSYEKSSVSEIWITDGTLKGTRFLTSVNSDILSAINYNSFEYKGDLYYQLKQGDSLQLWKIELDNNTISKTIDFNKSGIRNSYPYVTENLIWFDADSVSYEFPRVYLSDGTEEGTISLNSKDTLFRSMDFSYAKTCGEFAFIRRDNYYTKQLWKSNGTITGTNLLMSGNKTRENDRYNPRSFIKINENIYFKMDSNGDYIEDGIYLSKDKNKAVLIPTVGFKHPSYISDLFLYNSAVHYTVFADSLTSLFRIDPYTNKEEKILDFDLKNPRSSNPVLLKNINDDQFFYAEMGLWKTNNGNAKLVYQCNLDAVNQSVVMDSVLYFMGNHSRRGFELWRSNGTTDGTYPVKQFDNFEANSGHYEYRSEYNSYLDYQKQRQNKASYSRYGYDIVCKNNKLYIVIPELKGSMALYISEGTIETTKLLKKISSYSFSPLLTSSKQGIFFRTYEPVIDNRSYSDYTPTKPVWWKSDGTIEGTDSLVNFDQKSGYSIPMVNNENMYFFQNKDEKNLIWEADIKSNVLILKYNQDVNWLNFLGTLNNQWVMISDKSGLHLLDEADQITLIDPEIKYGWFDYKLNDKLVFYGSSKDGKRGLYISNGLASGTHLIKDDIIGNLSDLTFISFPWDSNFYFIQRNLMQKELWKSDGTAEGTKKVFDLPYYQYDFYFSEMISVNDRAYLTTYDPELGYELFTFTCEEKEKKPVIPEYTLYPNPTESLLNVKLPGNLKGCAGKIFNTFGKQVWEGNLNELNQVNVSLLNSGVYILKLDIPFEVNMFSFVKI